MGLHGGIKLAHFQCCANCWYRFQTQLAGPGLAFLWDHLVAGRSIMPGAGMAEMASAASHSLLQEAVPGRALCLTGASIPSPGILASQAGTLMDCLVHAAEGTVELSTVTAKGTGDSLLSLYLPQQACLPRKDSCSRYVPLSFTHKGLQSTRRPLAVRMRPARV